MVFNRFALMMVFRIILLTLVLSGLSWAFTHKGYYGVTLLLGLITIIIVVNLYHQVCKTNTELTRFLNAARYGDFSQHFVLKKHGAGFEKLAIEFDEIMQNVKKSRQQQEGKLHHLKSLTEHMPVPLISLFQDDKIQLHNNAARRLFGRINVNKLEDLNAFGHEFYFAIKKLEPGKRQLLNFSFDGMHRQLTVLMTQIVTDSIHEKVISMQDIHSELDDMQIQSWQDLVRVLTHEIKNSITPVTSLAKTATDLVDDMCLKLDETDNYNVLDDLEDVRRAVDTVAQRSDGLMQFIESYSSLSLLPAPHKKAIRLKEIFQHINDFLVNQWPQNGIDFKIQVEPSDLQVMADPDLLEQILINLLQNAQQALQTTENPQILLIARTNRLGYILIEVVDNGPGISSAIANEVFVPFFTTKKNGSGIGLALTRQIMFAHGGRVILGKSDSGGAKFTLIF